MDKAIVAICLMVLMSCGKKDSGDSSETKAGQSSVRISSVAADRVKIEVQLFRPADLSENLKDISEKMNAFLFSARAFGNNCTDSDSKEVSGDLVKSALLKFTLNRSCSYTVALNYGHSDHLLETNPALSRIFYETKPPLTVTADYLLLHDPVAIKLLLSLTEAGRAEGLIVEKIQGENYTPGTKIPIVRTKSENVSHEGAISEESIDKEEVSGGSETSKVSEEESTDMPVQDQVVPFFDPDIKALLSDGAGNCISCHSNAGGIFPDLSSKENALKYAGRMLKRAGNASMPPETSLKEGQTRLLSQEEQDLLKRWAESGGP